MYVDVTISGLDKAERAAKEILEHVEAIKRIQKDAAWGGLRVTMQVAEKETASGN